jgi:hypothetical protein
MQVRIKTDVGRVVEYGERRRSICECCGMRRMTSRVGVKVRIWIGGDRSSEGVFFIGQYCGPCAKDAEVL